MWLQNFNLQSAKGFISLKIETDSKQTTEKFEIQIRKNNSSFKW